MTSKAKVPTVLAPALLGISLLSGAALAQPGPAVTVTPGSLYLFGAFGGGPTTYGWSFRPDADLEVVQLGFCDGAPYSPVGLSEPHAVGIFDAAGALIVSTTIPAGTSASLVDDFWYVPVPATALWKGQVYTIGALLPAPWTDVILDSSVPAGQTPPITLDPRITWLQGVSDYPGSPTLTFPTIPCCGNLFGFFGPTFYISGANPIATVSIDVKPGAFPNSVNLRSNGVLPVAILGSASFDALKVDPASLTLSGAKVKAVGKGKYSCAAEDVNADGRLDLVCHFVTSQLTVKAGDSMVVLEGTTFAGARFKGQDTIRIVPN